MRGRSLLRESSTPSLCAFCAHRLGAARKPSHVQRRFLQSSRTALKPPAEAAALRETDDDQGSTRNGEPIQASWGRPGATGLGPTVNWGRPAFGSGGIPPAGPVGSWGRHNVAGDELPSGQGLSQSDRPKSIGSDLLPHELRARQLMLEREQKSQQRSVKINSGPGPETSRAGRPQPYNERDRLALARSALERKKARELEERSSRENGGRFKINRTFTRHSLGDSEPAPAPDHSGDLPRWSQLKRRGEEPARNESPPLENRFAQGRAQREEEARSGRYIPLQRGSRSVFNSEQSQSEPMKSELSRNISRNIGEPQQSETAGLEASSKSSQPRFTISRTSGPQDESSAGDTYRRDRTVPGIRSTIEYRQHKESLIAQSSNVKRQEVSEAVDLFRDNKREEGKQATDGWQAPKSEVDEREDRRARRPARFTEEKPTYDAMPRGKGREKAKRRQQFVEEDEDVAEREEAARRTELKRQRKKEKAAKKAAAPTPMLLPEYISVSNLAVALKVRVEDFVEKMEELGYEETGHDYILNAENAGLIAMEYNYEAIIDRGESENLKAREPPADPSILPQRPPVVTIMGHVDHGKTTLLDWLRKSSVAASEHGGITQHIGAFSVPMPSGKIITFLDTPGHAAFLSMRQRGANVTDIVILVVAADDSVKPQTIEAINHAKAAKVPIIVAINKIDKEDSNVDRVKQDLARHGVDVEDFGGDTQVVCVSGKTGQGMGELEEAAITLSEILDMRAETDGQAEGWVLEASIKSMGKVATILVRRGTMRPGDFIVAGKTWARIRCLRNEAGVEIDSAGPGTPVEIDGWRDQPLAGDEVLQAPDESKAKSVVDYRLEKEERDKMAEDMEAINEHRKVEQGRREREKAEAIAAAEAKEAGEDIVEVDRPAKATGPKQVYFVVKGDVSGSVEAVIDSISAIGNQEVQPHILRSGVGQLSEFDIEHAAAAKGHVINFNTTVDPNIARLAEEAKVTIFDQNIIYRLVDDVKAELSKHLPPLTTQRVLGEAEIAQIFEITVKGRQQKNIAGCKIRNGTVSKTAKVRVLRDGEKVFDGSLASLKNVKKDVPEMKRGSECGMGFEHWFDFKVGDHVQSYEEKEEKRYL